MRLRMALVATLAFLLGSATVVTAGPAVTGFVGLIDGSNTAAIDAARELSVTDATTHAKLDRLNDAAQPFAFWGGGFWVSGAPNQSNFFGVPAGQRLVIDQISASGEVTASATQKVSVIISTQINGMPAVYQVPAYDNGPAGIWEEFVANAQLHLYADPGTSVAVYVHRNDTSTASSATFVSVVGHLVDVP